MDKKETILYRLRVGPVTIKNTLATALKCPKITLNT